MWIAGSIGAALGDWLSYWIGCKLEYSRPAHLAAVETPDPDPARRRVHQEVGRARNLHRPLSGPLRASVPLIAGIFEMPFWRFQVANFVSAFVWCAVLLTLGDVASKGIKYIWG